MSDMGRLAQLATNPHQGASREEIYLAVASLYRIQGHGLSNRERDLMREILGRLTRDVEMAIRIALAQRLAADANAPHDLILLLADDTIEVAGPLILGSPLFNEADALNIIAGSSVAHIEAVAARANISVPVTDALVQSDVESVLVTLARNFTAKISEQSFATLVEKSRGLATLQEPLSRRPDLPHNLAKSMCDWVSDALKLYIRNNYKMTPKKVDDALVQAAGLLRDAHNPHENPADSARKLIDKLATSGQLKAGFLMRVLSQGQSDLFDLAFARILDVDLLNFRRQFYSGSIGQVATACRAAGIDRSVFPTVFSLSRQARDMPHALDGPALAEVDGVFAGLSRSAAQDAIKGAAAP